MSCALTSLDSADFGGQVVLMSTPMSYSSLGSCIFHKVTRCLLVYRKQMFTLCVGLFIVQPSSL